jgi:ABC-type sugar transport system ATPase subunit
MIRQIREQQRFEGTTMVVATNDWEVAAGLADRLAVLADGAIAQLGTAQDLYDRPATLDVAGRPGRWQLNRLAGRVRLVHGERTEIVTSAGSLRTWRTVPDQPMIIGIRPEDLEVVGSGPDTDPSTDGNVHHDGGGRLRATVESAAVLGRTSLVRLDADGIPLQAIGPAPAPEIGSTVRLAWRRAHVFDLNGVAIDHLD